MDTLIDHIPWLNTVIFILGDNDFDNLDDTIRHHRDITFTIMNTGRVLVKYGIRPFFIPLQNRRRPRQDRYQEIRTKVNFQLATHFSSALGYPAMVESLGHSDRTLKPDGVHFTELDYLEVAREIDLHLERYRLGPIQPQRPLMQHAEYLAIQGEFEELMGLGEQGSDSEIERVERGAELEQGNIENRVNVCKRGKNAGGKEVG